MRQIVERDRNRNRLRERERESVHTDTDDVLLAVFPEQPNWG